MQFYIRGSNPKTIADIVGAISSGRVRVTDHADEEASADGLKLDDIFSAVAHGEVIEEYPTDVPYPSCLIFGWTAGGSPVHSV